MKSVFRNDAYLFERNPKLSSNRNCDGENGGKHGVLTRTVVTLFGAKHRVLNRTGRGVVLKELFTNQHTGNLQLKQKTNVKNSFERSKAHETS